MTSATRRRRVLGALALAIILVVAVVLFTRGSGDDAKLIVTNGAAGFPLRGDLARDSAGIHAAAEAWLAKDAESSDPEFDYDDVELRALWAGRLDDEEVVILAAEHEAALVALSSGGTFHVRSVEPIRDIKEPTVVAFEQGILVDTQADPTFVPAGVETTHVAPRDGLWTTTGEHSGSALPDGGLVLSGGLPRLGGGKRTPPAAVLVSRHHSSTWLIDAGLQAKLRPGTETFAPEAYQRVVAATTTNDPTQWRRLFDPPDLRLVQDRTLPFFGPTMVLTASDRMGRDRILAANGGSPVAGNDEAEKLRLADGGNDGDGARGEKGPPLAAGLFYPEKDDEPVHGPQLLVAGNAEIATIEVLIGRRRIDRPGPVAVIELPQAKNDPLGDFAVLGRTRAGTVVVPRSVEG